MLSSRRVATAYAEKQESRLGSGTQGARATGLEPATSGVTGRRSNQLNYARWRVVRLADHALPDEPQLARLGVRVEHPQEGVHDPRVELRPGASLQFGARLRLGQGGAVDAVAR